LQRPKQTSVQFLQEEFKYWQAHMHSPRLLVCSLILLLLLLKLIATHPTNPPNMIIMGIRQPCECLFEAVIQGWYEGQCGPANFHAALQAPFAEHDM
jgi:hypothetical protein